MKSVTVVFNEKECTLIPLKARQTARWLRSVESEITGLVDKFLQAPETDLTDNEAIRELVSGITKSVPDAVEKIIDLLIEFSPENKDAIDAFVEAVLLAIPFDKILPKLNGLMQKVSAPTSNTQQT